MELLLNIPTTLTGIAFAQVSLLQAEANLATAQSNLVKAQQDYNRLKPLVEEDADERQDLDAATAGGQGWPPSLSARATRATARE